MAGPTATPLKKRALGDLDAGRLPQALKKAQLGIKRHPGDADYHAIAGFVLTEMKRYKQSIPHFAEASRLKPGDAQFVENLANALMQTNQIPRALSYAERKLEQFPNSKELVRVIDEIHLKGQNWRLIIDHTTKKLGKDPDDPDMLITRARAYGQVGFTDHGSRDISRAFEIAPEKENVALAKAEDLHQSGDKEGAKAILRAVLTRNPLCAAALYQISIVAEKPEAEDIARAVDAAISESDQTVSVLEFAKAHLISKQMGLNAALPRFARANAIQHDVKPYDSAREEKRFEENRKIFPFDVPPASAKIGDGPQPIFVIGQPRSGTTLMEMMLSSAPSLAGCGELTIAGELAQNFKESGKPFDAEAAAGYAADYRRLMPPIPADSIAFIDKMPHNYMSLGFILSAFPNARVINMMRDPRDVGLSKWIRRFYAPGMRYASNLGAIAHSANLYRRYVSHWLALFGDRILTVRYEDLVADPRSNSQTVAAFCGINWDERMMRPENNTRQVRTASTDQVRKKISTGSIGGWREAEGQIRPMLDGLDPALWPEYDFD